MRYKILDQKGLNFLTMTIVDWIDLFTRKAYCEIITSSLKYCRAEKGLLVNGYVIMPSHLHLILRSNGEKELTQVIKEFKSFTSKMILEYIKNYKNPESRREWLLQHFNAAAKNPDNNGIHKVWQKGDHPIDLYTPRVIRQKLLYIHNNPVNAGMVKSPEHYVYSSASNYSNAHLENGQKDCSLEIDIVQDIWNDGGIVGRR